MDQPLSTDSSMMPMPAPTYTPQNYGNAPTFSSGTFEEKFQNGWLKHYYHATIAFMIMCAIGVVLDIVGAVNIGVLGFGYVIAYLLIAALTLNLGAFFFFSYEAIKNRSLEKQDKALRFLALYIFGCVAYIILYIAFTGLSALPTFLFMGPILPMIVVGLIFLVLANNVKKVMLGKPTDELLIV